MAGEGDNCIIEVTCYLFNAANIYFTPGSDQISPEEESKRRGKGIALWIGIEPIRELMC